MWPPFKKELFIRYTICSFCKCLLAILVVSHSGFEGRTVVLIAPVPVIAYLLLSIS